MMERRFSDISIPELPSNQSVDFHNFGHELRKDPSGSSLSKRLPRKQQDRKHEYSNLYSTLFIALLALMVSTGGFGVALYNLFTMPSTADCTCNNLNKSSELEYQLGQSQAEVEALQEIVSQRCQNVTSNSTEAMVCNDTRLDRLESQVDDILTMLVEVYVANSFCDDINTTTEATTLQSNTEQPQLKDITENCTNIQLTQCAVMTSLFSTPPSFGVCSTMPVPIRVDGYYNLAMYCAITNPRTEQNPIITTLNVDESNNQMRCYCYVDVNSDDFTRAEIECALFATRCPIT